MTTLTPSDIPRLESQLGRVFELMRDGKRRTLRQIVETLELQGTYASEASVSARLRDLRKKGHGAHAVGRDRIGPGLFEYWVNPNPKSL